jgi:hypothetical protein
MRSVYDSRTTSPSAITAIAVGNAGSGYTSPPIVTITAAAGDTGTGATATTALTFASPTITQTFTVTVANPGSGNIFVVDGVNNPTIAFVRGGVYTFNQGNASNAGHQLAFKDGDGLSYNVGVVTTGTPGISGAQTVITVANGAPANLRYYCVAHGDSMGSTISVTGSGLVGIVSAFIITNGGSGYLVAPTITLSGGGGTNASAGTVTIGTGSVTGSNTVSFGYSMITDSLIGRFLAGPGMRLDGLTLGNSNFSGVNFSNVDISGTNLSSASLSGIAIRTGELSYSNTTVMPSGYRISKPTST